MVSLWYAAYLGIVRKFAKLIEIQPILSSASFPQPRLLNLVSSAQKQTDLPIPIMSAPAPVPRLHVSNLDKAFPLTEAPLCLRCKQPTQREEVQIQGLNHGRWRYNCQACLQKHGPRKNDRSVSFCTWDDDVGIDVRNPLCRCDLPSREGHCGYGSRAPGKIFLTCAVGKCSYEFWPGIWVDVLGGAAQALLSCTCSMLPATFQPASGGTIAIVYDEFCLLHGIPLHAPVTPKRAVRVAEQPLTPRATARGGESPPRRPLAGQAKLQFSPATSTKEAALLTMDGLKIESPLGKRRTRADAADEESDVERERSPSKKPFKAAILKYKA